MKTRNWSIRSKIITMVTVPLVALLALWIFATALTAAPAFKLLSAREMADNVSNPGEVVLGELQRERRVTVQFLADPSASPGQLTQQRAATDRAIGNFRGATRNGDVWSDADDTLRQRLGQFFTEMDNLPAQRQHVDRRELDPIGTQNFYNGMIQAGFDMFAATATFPDDEMDRQIRAIGMVGRGQEYLSRVDSLLAVATVSGRFTDETRSALVQDIGTARFLLLQGVQDMPEASRAQYQTLSGSDAFVQLNRMMDRMIGQSRVGELPPVGADSWHPAFERSGGLLRDFVNDAVDALADRGSSLALKILLQLLGAALLGLFALAVSVTVSVKFGRSMVGRLRRLRGEALEMATERLPHVVRRLQRGEIVDVEVETPPLEYGRDEIGQLGHAFNDVQRTAVRSAVDEATVRRGLNEVFLNIARRSQTLLHRQLALLDKMERRETEPRELEDLYRVDHLATRMRRHAEDLVILAGAAPGRGWRNPVPVIDVVRGAISEVEDYKRIDIRAIESSAVLGRAVGDVIHLLAELLENATSYSPPQTRVQVSGQVLPNGYAVEIEDRGLGMTPEAIEEANRRLIEPPDFDPADSARLGLFVVAQLSHRHGIRVSLRPSPYGGVTAIVMVPGELVATGEQSPGPSGPLVGSGTDDPLRRSLAALQWQGGEELRELTASGQPVSLNGIITAIPAIEPRTRPQAEPGTRPQAEPRTRPQAEPRTRPQAEPAARPAQTEAEPEPATRPDPEPTTHPIPLQRRRSPREISREIPRTAPSGPTPSSVAEGLSADGLVQRRRVRRPAEPEKPAPATTDDGLPKRVRQASLAPQLRKPASAEQDEPTVPMRSPEQLRSIMSALQSGTTRGRMDAAKYLSESSSEDRPKPKKPGNGGSPTGASFEDAATVSFPAIANVAITGGATNGAEAADGDRADRPGHDSVTRPEEDA